MAGRVADYDTIADQFDRRYRLYRYDGVRDTLATFLENGAARRLAVLEVGCGTGHWLREMASSAGVIAGVEPSFPMLSRARSEGPRRIS